MPDNTIAVQAMYEAFGRQDMAFVIKQLRENVEWISCYNMHDIPWGGERHGVAGAQSFFVALVSHLVFEAFEPRLFAAEGKLVFVQGRTLAKVKGTGRRFDCEWVHVFTFEAGSVTRFQEF